MSIEERLSKIEKGLELHKKLILDDELRERYKNIMKMRPEDVPGRLVADLEFLKKYGEKGATIKELAGASGESIYSLRNRLYSYSIQDYINIRTKGGKIGGRTLIYSVSDLGHLLLERFVAIKLGIHPDL